MTPTYPVKLSPRRRHPETRRYTVEATCPGCDYSRTVWLRGWSSIVCGGCKATLSKPGAL